MNQQSKDEITGRARFVRLFLDINPNDFYVGLSHGEKQSDYWRTI